MKKILLIIGLMLLLTGAYFACLLYQRPFSTITKASPDTDILYIHPGADLEDIIDSLLANHQIVHPNRFRWTADKMGYDNDAIRPGRYTVTHPSNSKTLVALLRGGRQTPLKVTIQNVRTIEQMCGRVAAKLEFDSLSLIDYIETKFDSISGTVPATRMTRFIPNTYEFYWTVSPEDFCLRMLKEYNKFWSAEKKAKAEAIGLSPEEVYTLASIIEKETNYNPEKTRMAGVYLNRIEQGIPLQADPTVVFAVGDFEIRRVLYGHLAIDSPYNTYKYPGLPPGPIFMPGIASINAVLDKEDNDYIYFCARPTDDGPGHAFAKTLSAHNVNAARYQRWLDQQGIR